MVLSTGFEPALFLLRRETPILLDYESVKVMRDFTNVLLLTTRTPSCSPSHTTRAEAKVHCAPYTTLQSILVRSRQSSPSRIKPTSCKIKQEIVRYLPPNRNGVFQPSSELPVVTRISCDLSKLVWEEGIEPPNVENDSTSSGSSPDGFAICLFPYLNWRGCQDLNLNPTIVLYRHTR